jgi:hypothetical protein
LQNHHSNRRRRPQAPLRDKLFFEAYRDGNHRLRRASASEIREGLRVGVALYTVVFEVERGTRLRLLVPLPNGIDLNQSDDFCSSLLFQLGDRFAHAITVDEDE